MWAIFFFFFGGGLFFASHHGRSRPLEKKRLLWRNLDGVLEGALVTPWKDSWIPVHLPVCWLQIHPQETKHGLTSKNYVFPTSGVLGLDDVCTEWCFLCLKPFRNGLRRKNIPSLFKIGPIDAVWSKGFQFRLIFVKTPKNPKTDFLSVQPQLSWLKWLSQKPNFFPRCFQQKLITHPTWSIRIRMRMQTSVPVWLFDLNLFSKWNGGDGGYSTEQVGGVVGSNVTEISADLWYCCTVVQHQGASVPLVLGPRFLPARHSEWPQGILLVCSFWAHARNDTLTKK